MTQNAVTLIPRRVKNPDFARCVYGPLADRLFAALTQGDPLADAAIIAMDEAKPSSETRARWLDAVMLADDTSPATKDMPEALMTLIREAKALPSWVDFDRCDRAGRLLFRAGPLGGIVLAARSLLGGYISPAGNKPLMFSGQLSDNVQFRLAETGRFVVETCRPGGLVPGAPGFGITLRVRLMHARVRTMLLRSPKWKKREWGVPISQHDLVGTSLLFSTIFVDGLRLLGLHVSEEEESDYAHLWRVSGWIMGVDEALQPTDNFECYKMGRLIADTQAAPDDDSVELTRALLSSPRVSMHRAVAPIHIALGESFARFLLGDEIADALEIRRRPIASFLPKLTFGVNTARRLLGTSDRDAMEERGLRYWEANLKAGFDGRPATFSPTRRLTGTPKQPNGTQRTVEPRVMR